jgi:LAO/AO transport system kinase
VGKSTFINAFGSQLTQRGHRLAVLAIDPSSRLTGGSILGDKTRMDQLSHDERAYVRPSPAGESLGGVARRTREAMLLCEAAGYEVVFVETVGVGQSETAIREMTDLFLLLMLPNAGDELQGMKKGIMEMADVLVINKADGGMEARAKSAKAGYAQALRLFPAKESGWLPPVLLASAQTGMGLEDIRITLDEYRKLVQQNGHWDTLRREQSLHWMREAIVLQLQDWFFARPGVQERIQTLEAQVLAQTISPMHAADELMREIG